MSAGGQAVLVLQAERLYFAYPEHPLFTGWSAAMHPGVTLLRGGDGRGKTTLMRLLAGELSLDAGQLGIKGIPLHDQREAYVRQLFWTDPRTDAFDLLTPIAYLQMQRLRYPAFDEQVLGRLLDGLALDAQMHKQLFMLSTGSKRKVFLAAAFASGAAVTLLDMPFGALDKASIGCVLELLEEASSHPERVWVMADHVVPAQLRLAGLIDLDD